MNFTDVYCNRPNILCCWFFKIRGQLHGDVSSFFQRQLKNILTILLSVTRLLRSKVSLIRGALLPLARYFFGDGFNFGTTFSLYIHIFFYCNNITVTSWVRSEFFWTQYTYCLKYFVWTNPRGHCEHLFLRFLSDIHFQACILCSAHDPQKVKRGTSTYARFS